MTQTEIAFNSYDLRLVCASLIIICLAEERPEYVLTQSTTHFNVQTETVIRVTCSVHLLCSYSFMFDLKTALNYIH